MVSRCLVVEGMEGIEFITVTEEMEAVLLLERHSPGAGEAVWSSEESIYRLTNHEPRVWVFPRLLMLQWRSRAPSPHHIFHPDGRRREPLRADYILMRDERNPDTSQNYEGDPTHGPLFIGPPGLFSNGIVKDDLEAAAIMWYTGGVRLGDEVPRGIFEQTLNRQDT